MVNFLQIKRNYKIYSMYPQNPYIFDGWNDNTSTHSTYFNLSADSGAILDKYGHAISVNNGVTVAQDGNGKNYMQFTSASSNYLKVTTMPTVDYTLGFWQAIVLVGAQTTNYGLAGKTLAGSDTRRYGLFANGVVGGSYQIQNIVGTNIYTLSSGIGLGNLSNKIIISNNKQGQLPIANQIYYNGIKYTGGSVITGSFSADTLANYWIGCYGNSSNTTPLAGSYFDGKLYCVMQGSGNLSDKEASDLYKFLKQKYSL